MLAPVLLAHASLTEPLVRLATNLIADLGLAGVALLTLTSGVIGVPGTEPTMLFAGFDVFQGNLTLPGVIVAGVKTNVCIRATVQDAFAHGFAVVVPREATNSNRPHLAAASLEDIERYFGMVVSIDRALEMLA